MNKVCLTCGRENAAESFQCHACRSRDFGSDGTFRQYRETQRRSVHERRNKRLDEAIETYRLFPGAQRKLALAVVSAFAVTIGYFLFQRRLGKVLFFLGLTGLGWVNLILRIDGWRDYLKRRRGIRG